MFINIDRERRPQKPKYFLAKPNQQIIANMTSYKSQDSGTFKLANIDEINFTVPYYIDKDFKHVYNEDIDLIKEKMLIKMVLGTNVEWFIIDEIEDTGDDSETMTITAYSLGYELTHKDIPVFEAISVNASDALMAILEDPHFPTAWKVEKVHYKFENLFRSFEMSNTNALDAVFQIAEAFDALVKFDTSQRRISFLDKEDDGKGKFKGLSVDYGKLLKTFRRNRTSDEMVTRLYVSGNEGLGIHNVNPTGQSYIEDFSYYMYPFEMDANGNVLRSSDFMSDELCIALEKYSALIDQFAPQFKLLNQNRALLITQRTQEETKLFELETQLDAILDRLDTAKAVENQDLINTIQGEKSAKESEIANQNVVLNGIKSSIFNVERDINDLVNKLRQDANFTEKLVDELKLYIVEKRFDDDRYIDEQELYDDALKKFKTMREPKVVLTIDVENFLEIVEEQYYWDKLVLGDLIKIRYPLMNIEYMATIVQIDYDFEGGSISLTIANTTKLNENDEMREILYNSKTASSIVMNNKYIWDKVGELDGRVWKLLNEEWDANKQKITAGVNNEIEIGKRGVIVTNPDNPNEIVVMQSGIIALSEDGGETWKTAMKPNGIVAERIIGKLIMGTKLIIEDESGIIRFTGSLQEVFDKQGNVRVEIGEYKKGVYGMRIHSGAIEIVNGLPKSQIDPSAVGAWDSAESNAKDYANGRDSTLRSDLRLVSKLPNNLLLDSTGITASTSTVNSFARLDYRGLYVQGGALDIRTSTASNQGIIINGSGISGYDYSGTRKFHVDTNGNLYAQNGTFGGSLNGANGTFTGTLSAVNGSFSGTLSGANITGATGNFTGTLSGANITGATGTFSGNLSSATFTSGTISGTNITGSNITGGTISSNTSINVTTDLYVGNNIYLGSQSDRSTKAIRFNNSAIISTDTEWSINISANRTYITGGSVHLGGGGVTSVIINGQLNLASATVNWGTNAPVAKFG